jgi:hypothetical protein
VEEMGPCYYQNTVKLLVKEIKACCETIRIKLPDGSDRSRYLQEQGGTTWYRREKIVFKGLGQSYMIMETGDVCCLFMVN